MYAEVKAEATIFVSVWCNGRLERNYETQIEGWDIEDWVPEAWDQGEFGYYHPTDSVTVVVVDVMGNEYRRHIYDPPEPD